MEEFLSQLLGTTSVPSYLAGFALALMGAILSLRIYAKTRNKKSVNTPYEFSWRFLILDNLNRLITGFLLTFIAFRFTGELIGVEFTMWSAFLIGLLLDQVAGLLSKLNLARK